MKRKFTLSIISTIAVIFSILLTVHPVKAASYNNLIDAYKQLVSCKATEKVRETGGEVGLTDYFYDNDGYIHFYYTIYDIDHNGQKEFLLGYNYTSKSIHSKLSSMPLSAIWSIKKNTYQLLVNGWVRNTYNVYKNGIIYNNGSGGAYDSQINYYRYSSSNLKKIVSFNVHGNSDGSVNYHNNLTNKYVSKKVFKQKTKHFKKSKVKLHWKKLI